MKKLFACLLVCSLLLSTCASAALITDIDQTTNPEAVDYLVELGVLTTEKDEFLPAQTMTRAEYVDAVLRLIGVDSSEYTGSGNTDIYDVTEYMEYYSAVLFALDMGLVTGNGDGTFRPKDIITVSDAVVILVRALGYEPLAQDAGGYTAGYLSRANRLDLLIGIEVSGELTRDVCAQLLYNALEVEIMKAVSYGGDSVVLRSVEGETVLTEYHNVQQVRGLVTEQVYQMPEEDAEKGYIRLEDGTMLYYDGTEDLVGEKLEIHYRENKANNRKTIFQIIEDSTVNTLTLDAADATYGSLTYSYGENKTARISSLTRVFYNGKEMDPFDATLLDPAIGTIKLIDNSQGYYQVLKISSYRDYHVEAVNSTEQIIYDKNSVSQPFSYKDVNCMVLSGDSVMSVDSISNGAVISVAMSIDGEKARVLVSNNVKSEGSVFTYKSDSYGDYCSMIVGEDTLEYLISPALAATLKSEVKPGDVMVAYLDVFGYIAGYEKGASMDYVYGYLANAQVNDSSFSKNLQLKILTESGELVTYYTEEKINMDGDSKTPAVDCYDKLSASQLIRYIVNESGKVTAIDTAYSSTNPRGQNETEDSFHLYYANTSANATWNSSSSTLEGIAVIDTSKTKQWLVPEDPKQAEADDFEISYSPANNAEYMVQVYKSNADSFVAELVIYFPTSAATYGSGSRPLFINYAYQGMDKDGDTVTFLNGFRNGSEVNLEIKDGCTGKTHKGDVIDVADLQGGDIVRILTDSKGRISEVQLLWDRSAAESGDWEDGACFANNPTSGDYNNTVRFLYGDVYATEGGYFKVRYGGSATTNTAEMPAFLSSKSTFYTYGPHGDGTWFKKGSASDLLPVVLDPVNHSKVFIRQYYTTTQLEVVIFNEQ